MTSLDKLGRKLFAYLRPPREIRVLHGPELYEGDSGRDPLLFAGVPL